MTGSETLKMSARGSPRTRTLSRIAIYAVLAMAYANLWAFVNAKHVEPMRRRTRAKASSSDLPDKWKAGPAEIYTGVAQKAVYLMKENPTLFDMSVEEELEKLQEEKEEEEKKE